MGHAELRLSPKELKKSKGVSNYYWRIDCSRRGIFMHYSSNHKIES